MDPAILGYATACSVKLDHWSRRLNVELTEVQWLRPVLLGSTRYHHVAKGITAVRMLIYSM